MTIQPPSEGVSTRQWAADVLQFLAGFVRTDGLPRDGAFLAELADDWRQRTEDGGLVCACLDSLPIYRGSETQ